MTSQLAISTEGRLGVIALDRPEAINALSAEMIGGITAQLAAWRDDAGINAVLFEGRGPKGFCAGGDVRYVRQQALEGRPAAGDAYFAAEYRMNALIATYAKPVIALTDGVVMGGGIGIAGHARFRFTTPTARYAMPEPAIGFFADVGVNWILGHTPEHRALLFLMTGLTVSGADVLALGLADCCIDPARLREVRARVASAANTAGVEPALAALMQSESIQAGERQLCTVADRLIEVLQEERAADIVAAIEEEADEDSAIEPIAAVLRTRSPTSLETILASHRAARVLPDVEAVLALDRRVASFLFRQPDFVEGVRAVLIDKDMKPNWNPPGFEGVRHVELAAAIDPPTGASTGTQG